LEALLIDFDMCWTPDRLDSDVRRLPADGSFRLAAIREMVKIDLERQARRGAPIPVQQYLERFPELGAVGSTTADLLGADAGADSSTPPLDAATVAPVKLPEQFGRYRIIRQLGRGGMGSVYLAHDTELDRRVALKVPHFRADDTSAIERFSREARAAATIDHPNVCRVYDVGRIGDTPFLTMAYVEGPTLADELRNGPLPPRAAVEIARDTAMALAEAHRRGVIHRDLKPGNIILARQESGQSSVNEQPGAESTLVFQSPSIRPVVTDFGLARRGSEDKRLTTQGEILGTPLYMPPEQIAGDTDRIGPASDIYALGAVLYEAMTGRPPFAGSRSDVFQQALTQAPSPPSSVRSEVDPRLDSIVLRALAKRPADRFGGMTAFADALDEWLKGNTRRRAAWSPPIRWIVGGVIAVLVLAILVAFAVKLGWIIAPIGGNATVPANPPGEGESATPLTTPRLLGGATIADSKEHFVALSMTPGGRDFVAALAGEGHVRLVHANAITGQARAIAVERVPNNWAAFSSDGRRFLAGGGGDDSELIQIDSGAVVQRFPAGPRAMAGAFSRDGQRILIASEKAAMQQIVQVWDSSSGGELGKYEGHKEKVHTVALSDQGDWALSISDDRSAVWEVKTGKGAFEERRTTSRCAVFIPGTSWYATGNAHGQIAVLDLSEPHVVLHYTEQHQGAVTCLAASADGKLLLSGSADKTIRAWDPGANKAHWQLSNLPAAVTALAISEDRKRMGVALSNGAWQVWEIP
jgi:serine/threonine protein kinase